MDKDVIDIDYEVIDKKEIEDTEENNTQNSQNYESNQSNTHYYSSTTVSDSVCLVIPLIVFAVIIIFLMVFM